MERWRDGGVGRRETERCREKPRQNEAPLCLPWGAWARGPAETTPHHPTNLRPAPSSLQEGGREQARPAILAAPWDAPLDKSHPLPPLLGHMGGAVSDLLSGQRLLPEKCGGQQGAGEGEERRGKGGY